jgi:hypothetical protein
MGDELRRLNWLVIQQERELERLKADLSVAEAWEALAQAMRESRAAMAALIEGLRRIEEYAAEYVAEQEAGWRLRESHADRLDGDDGLAGVREPA